MYKYHPIFDQPSNESERVWRYMDFTKLVSILETRSLYFARSDKLGDPFEGSYPRVNVISRENFLEGLPSEVREKNRDIASRLGDTYRQLLKYTFVNCWNLSNHESAAMWRLYLQGSEGVSIQSTYGRLRDSFDVCNRDIFLGKVSYLDYETEMLDPGNAFSPFVHKRKSFEHEREVRAVFVEWDRGKRSDDGLGGLSPLESGLHVQVDINVLIESIYVAPSAPAWFAELVRSVVKRYGCAYPVLQSDLAREPLY